MRMLHPAHDTKVLHHIYTQPAARGRSMIVMTFAPPAIPAAIPPQPQYCFQPGSDSARSPIARTRPRHRAERKRPQFAKQRQAALVRARHARAGFEYDPSSDTCAPRSAADEWRRTSTSFAKHLSTCEPHGRRVGLAYAAHRPCSAKVRFLLPSPSLSLLRCMKRSARGSPTVFTDGETGLGAVSTHKGKP